MNRKASLSNANDELLTRILCPAPEPYALLYRPEYSEEDCVEIVKGKIDTLTQLSDLSAYSPSDSPTERKPQVLAIIPYRQVYERGFECIDDNEPLIALHIESSCKLKKAEVLQAIEETDISLVDGHFDINDDDYADIAKKIIDDEIGTGSGSNFVLKRTFITSIKNFNHSKALTFFRRLLKQEMGSYWIFIVFTGDRFFVGASPERHISLKQTVATMNPISGTYRYPISGPSVEGILDFLSDSKEKEELYMVVDEELKMMGNVCEAGGTIHGPYLKTMARLAHTEYLLTGESFLKPWEILRQTLFAPTITGSPIENACRIIKKYEPQGRSFYSGVIALLGRDEYGQHELDSAILIRTADINNRGNIKIATGSTLVRSSDPLSEAIETRTKAAGLLSALGVRDSMDMVAPVSAAPKKTPKEITDLSTDSKILEALQSRNDHISSFWKASPKNRLILEKKLNGRKALVLDAEDTFTSMICHQLRALGMSVTVINARTKITYDDFEIVVLGPGPGDPGNTRDPRIRSLTNAVKKLLFNKHPFLAICLSHQILCRELGLYVTRRNQPNQGTQKEIELFGDLRKVGFYNTFSARSEKPPLPSHSNDVIEVSKDPDSGEVHALRGSNFASFQFHPESILTELGALIIQDSICNILKPKI